ncbi:putative F-box/LRR-repeat protein 23 isoform X1 [Brachypodium distachyon]|uniref:F-box domain-containing protein n=1 Tax=Brachypodium distachyon TaxID=15368 RepID=A0A2K2DSY3_BRADI|nr:putative F-box/LRR-repeat protein 23 isoform X1 [Brachypodium distachyon]PNT77389.1 hypothetical protein BRADI_1g61973v3 [Brachypodium distachyon]|eukprot:XP_010228601.3 putative F-box/LRR-repeat protein 23 isoform X1 [Brachypodium distachyon]
MASSSSSSLSRRWPRVLEETPPSDAEAPDWAELPRDALLTVLHRLGHVDILMGPGQVCRPWRRAARDEPELWRRVELRFPAGLSSRLDPCKMARDAIRRSSEQCEAFLAQGAVDCSVLSFLADSVALSLKSLRLVSCQGIYDSMRLASVITKFSLLEELELSNCWGAFPETCAAVGKACPLLTRLRLSNKRFIKRDQNVVGGEARAIATTMPALRSLQLFANRLGNRGLVAILDGCPRLESLDIRHCFNVVMDDDMRARCSRIQTLRLPRDSTDDYDLDFSSPDMDPPGERRHLAVFYDDEWEFSSR